MKTIWKWNNILKWSFTMIVASAMWGLVSFLFNISIILAAVLGFLIGMIAGTIGMTKWELWEFE